MNAKRFGGPEIALALSALASIVALGGCATMNIATDWDPAVDFAKLETYDWIPEPEPGGPGDNDSLITDRVHRAVDRELAAKGYRRQTSGTPDFLIGYYAAVESKLDVQVLNDYYGYRPGWGSWDYGVGSRTHVREVHQGTLILDISNPHSAKLMWRGIPEAEVPPAASPQESEETISEAVRLVLERFPPQG